MVLTIILLVLASYAMGSIPTSIWVSKLILGKDIRNCGSGNAGATNVFRTFGWKPALVVALFDVFKGWLPVALFVKFSWFQNGLDPSHEVYAQILAGLAAICGHVWTLFAKFRGGKGVATALGMLVALFPMAIPICLLVFFVVVKKTGFVSLGSILASVSLPIILVISHFSQLKQVSMPLMYFSLLFPFLIAWTHRTNIRRLSQGTETKIKKP